MKNRILGWIGESFCTVRMEIFLGCIIQFYESISYFNTIVMCFISLNMWAKICVTPFRMVYIYLCTHKGGYKRFGRGLRKPFSNFFFLKISRPYLINLHCRKDSATCKKKSFQTYEDQESIYLSYSTLLHG